MKSYFSSRALVSTLLVLASCWCALAHADLRFEVDAFRVSPVDPALDHPGYLVITNHTEKIIAYAFPTDPTQLTYPALRALGEDIFLRIRPNRGPEVRIKGEPGLTDITFSLAGVNLPQGTAAALVLETSKETIFDKLLAGLPGLGDANGDGEFNSVDLVQIYTAGNVDEDRYATWSQGDFNNDRRFTTADLVLAMTGGAWEQRLWTPPDEVDLREVDTPPDTVAATDEVLAPGQCAVICSLVGELSARNPAAAPAPI